MDDFHTNSLPPVIINGTIKVFLPFIFINIAKYDKYASLKMVIFVISIF